MDRRNFFKIVSTVSAGAASVACSSEKSSSMIPLLVSDHEIVPGTEQWHPSVCTGCEAGCGVITRVMRGERVIERAGSKFREPIACIKKIEGNPLDAVSGGRLCARGHAQLQSIYNPDRLQGPMGRKGERGKADFVSVTWDEAIAGVSEKLAKVHFSDASKILFLTSAHQSSRLATISRFLKAVGAGPAASCSVGKLLVERKAAEAVFGWTRLPRYDLANAKYVLGVGADFLGSWASPVYYARQFGHFRQGRPGLRGKLVQAESRMSVTASSADEWLPLRPGSEPQLLIAIARMLLDEKMLRGGDVAMLEPVRNANLTDLISQTGLPEKRLRRIAHELGSSEAPLVVAGASVVHTNSVEAIACSHYLNILLGNVGEPGGIYPPIDSAGDLTDSRDILERLGHAQILLLDGENPLYGYPRANGIQEALGRIETIISFGGAIDDTSAYADWILPDHHALESEAAVVPSVSDSAVSFAVSRSFVRPLYNTLPMQQTLGAVAQKMKRDFKPVSARDFVEASLKEGETWDAVAQQGGLWRDELVKASLNVSGVGQMKGSSATFAGEYPLHFQPYLSLQYHDGSGANLPWMQEMPDVVSSAMWNLPLEVDPQTAASLKVTTGDWVQVKSDHGKLEAQVYVHPAALPGVVSMGIGEGHVNYGRYASGRGVNPLSILAPVYEAATGALAYGGTRVKVNRLDGRTGEFAQFSPQDREQGPWGYR